MNPIQNPTSKFQNNTLYPVILAVPQAVKDHPPRERVKFLSRQARRALEVSAEKSGVQLGKLEQDERNAPLPFDGVYWSITHKTEYVGGVIAPYPVGIDIEKICSRTKALFQKIAKETEWSLADKTFKTFFRYWTAKEAVLKAAGIGLTALSKCRVVGVPDEQHLDIEYDTNTYHIQHQYYKDHIASIVTNKFNINWTIV